MERVVNIFKTLVAMLLMSAALFGLWRLYDSYVTEQKDVYWSIEDKPSKEDLNQLTAPLIENLPQPDETKFFSKLVLSSILIIYNNPNDKTEDLLMENIEKQGIWDEVELNGSKSGNHKFCYKQFELSVNNNKYNTFQFKDSRDKSLTINVGWHRTGVCRSKFIQRLVAKEQLNKPI